MLIIWHESNIVAFIHPWNFSWRGTLTSLQWMKHNDLTLHYLLITSCFGRVNWKFLWYLRKPSIATEMDSCRKWKFTFLAHCQYTWSVIMYLHHCFSQKNLIIVVWLEFLFFCFSFLSLFFFFFRSLILYFPSLPTLYSFFKFSFVW